MSKRTASSDSTQSGHKEKKSCTQDEELIDDANDLPINEFVARYVDKKWLSYQPTTSEPQLEIAVKPVTGLSGGELHACFDLIRTTSQHDYQPSSIGWHPKAKQREMKEDGMRYLLVRRQRASNRIAGEIGGFLSFLLTHDSLPPVPVLYIYEIHLASSLRGLGLGAHLMRAAEDIARRVGVRKVMLTCFVSNEKAYEFYGQRGYVKDVISPGERMTRRKTVPADYVIMGKDV